MNWYFVMNWLCCLVEKESSADVWKHQLLLFFLLYYSDERERERERERVRDCLDAHTRTHGQTVRIFCKTFLPFCSLGWTLYSYIIFRTSTQILVVISPSTHRLHVAHRQASFNHATHANYRIHTISLPPIQWSWSRFLPACHPPNLRGISLKNMRPVYLRN